MVEPTTPAAVEALHPHDHAVTALVYIDSNVLLQCKPLKEIPWGQVVGQDQVVIVVPRAVQKELDSLKADGNGRRASRARGAVGTLRQILTAPDGQVQVDPARPVLLKLGRPRAFAREEHPDLDADRADDQIILEILQARADNPADDIRLLSDDTNLLATAQHHRIAIVAADPWRLQPEPDERDRRIRQLEVNLAEVTKRDPAIQIELRSPEQVDGRSRIEIGVFEPLTESEINGLVDDSKHLRPRKEDFGLSAREQLLSMGLYGGTRPPSADAIERYFNKYEEWASHLRDRLKDMHSWFALEAEHFELELDIGNSGRAAANFVLLRIELPQGMKENARLDEMMSLVSQAPKCPAPPKPTSFADVLSRPSIYQPPFIPSHGVESLDRHAFYSRDSEDEAVLVLECEEVRHQWPATSVGVTLQIDREVTSSKGVIEVVVTAQNMPVAMEHRIPFDLVLVERSTYERARLWLEQGLLRSDNE